MNQKQIDKIKTEKETFGLRVCGYQIDNKDVDIFSCLTFDEHFQKDNDDNQTRFVYIASGHIFCGLNLWSLILCILSNFLFFKATVPHCFFK